MGIGGNVSSPHIAGRQVDGDVENIVRVEGVAVTQLHGLAVRQVGIDDVQQRLVVAIGGEVRNQQHVTNAIGIERHSASGRGARRQLADDGWGGSVACDICGCGAVKHHGACVCGHARQAANHGSNAQGEKIFSHM